MTPYQFIAFICIIEFSGTYATCPIGFKFAEYKHETGGLCYRLKHEEIFLEFYNYCAGNLYTSELFNKLNIPWDSNTAYIWTQYITVYPNGPFIDLSFTDSMPTLLDKDVDRNETIDNSSCVVMSSSKTYKSVDCSSMVKRYCLVHTYEDNNPKLESCKTKKGVQFYSPYPTCLGPAHNITGGTKSWEQMKDKCADDGGQLLTFGWIYGNHYKFSGRSLRYPLGFDSNLSISLIKSHTSAEAISVPLNDSTFLQSLSTNSNLIPVTDGKDRFLVEKKDAVFTSYRCEYPLSLKSLILKLEIDERGRLILEVNEPVDSKFIMCFTDAEQYYETKVEFVEYNKIRVLNAKANGYYHCRHFDTVKYTIESSNFQFYAPDKNSLERVYRAKLKLNWSANANEFQNISEKLNEFVYLMKVNSIKHGNIEVSEDTLANFNSAQPFDVREVLSDVTPIKWFIKQSILWIDFKVDFCITSEYKGIWKDIEVVFIRPLYYCHDDKTGKSAMNVTGEPIKDTNCKMIAEDLTEDMAIADANNYCKQKKNEERMKLMAELESIINDKISPSVESIKNPFDRVNRLLYEYKDEEVPEKLLHYLEDIGAKLEITGSHEQIVKENIALVVAKADKNHPVKGLKVAVGHNDYFSNESVQILREEITPNSISTKASEIVVKIPESMSASKKVSFVVYRNDRGFRRPGSRGIVNSRVISITVENVTQFQENEYIDIYLQNFVGDPGRDQKRVCAYWKFIENKTGHWQEGCTLMRSQDGTLDYCRCNHLTHFAQLIIPKKSFETKHENLLEFISIIGCLLSILGLILVGVTAFVFKSWYNNLNNKIWLQLCLSIFVTTFCFLVIIFANFQKVNISCKISGIVLHYSTLASFCWMFVAAFIAYSKLVVIVSQNTPRIILKCCLFSWGIPCVVIGVLFSIAYDPYSAQFNEELRRGTFCYPTGLSLWLSVYAPIALILLANWTLYILILRSLFASRTIRSHEKASKVRRHASVSCFLVVLFGLPWIFALFKENIVTVYLFTLTAPFQGFILFLFFVPCNKKTRDMWFKKIKTNQKATNTPTGLSPCTNDIPLSVQKRTKASL